MPRTRRPNALKGISELSPRILRMARIRTQAASRPELPVLSFQLCRRASGFVSRPTEEDGREEAQEAQSRKAANGLGVAEAGRLGSCRTRYTRLSVASVPSCLHRGEHEPTEVPEN